MEGDRDRDSEVDNRTSIPNWEIITIAMITFMLGYWTGEVLESRDSLEHSTHCTEMIGKVVNACQEQKKLLDEIIEFKEREAQMWKGMLDKERGRGR